jgi:hypothetical protein
MDIPIVRQPFKFSPLKIKFHGIAKQATFSRQFLRTRERFPRYFINLSSLSINFLLLL